MIQNLTDSFLRNVKAADGRADYRDAKTPGLVFRVSGRSKSWSVLYRRKSDGKRRRVTLGDYPDYSLADARQEALKIMAGVARREDPAKAAKRPSPSKPRTFGELAARYLENHAKHKRSGDEDEKMLNKDVLPALEGEPFDAIDRADIAAIVDGIVARGSPVRANRTFAVIRKVFNWGIEKGFIDYAPTFRMKPPANETSRDRVLSDKEIKIFWRRIIARGEFSWEMRTILKLCLVTGQRVSEVAGIAKSELRLDKAEWHIPRERTKNKLPHIVPLSLLAVRLIEKAVARSECDDLILANPRTGAQITKNAPAMSMRRNKSVFGFEPHVTPHDLRRTLASGLGEFRFSRLIQDKVLNHVTADRSVSAVYDRYAYMKEKREALEAWADHLQAVIFNKRPEPLAIVRNAAWPSKVSSPWAAVS